MSDSTSQLRIGLLAFSAVAVLFLYERNAAPEVVSGNAIKLHHGLCTPAVHLTSATEQGGEAGAVLGPGLSALRALYRFEEFLRRANAALGEDNQRHFARFLENLAKSSERFDSISTKAEMMLTEARLSYENINKVFGAKNQQQIDGTLDNFKKSSDRLPALVNTAEHLIYEARVATRKLEGIVTRSDKFFLDLEDMSKPFSERGNELLHRLEDMTCNLNRLAVDGREMMLALSRSDGTLQRLASDPSLFLGVNASVGAVNQMLPRLDRVLRDLEIFSDKIARHPEALGLGGVVRPSSGLKGTPTALPYRGP